MVALCLGVEHLAGLLQLVGGDRKQDVFKDMRVLKDKRHEEIRYKVFKILFVLRPHSKPEDVSLNRH